jgi:hypothetical protein
MYQLTFKSLRLLNFYLLVKCPKNPDLLWWAHKALTILVAAVHQSFGADLYSRFSLPSRRKSVVAILSEYTPFSSHFILPNLLS